MMSSFYIDYINNKPHQIYFLSSPRLLVFPHRLISANEAAENVPVVGYTFDAATELTQRGLI